MMDPKDFVHLHVHSHFSLLEALPSPKKLVSRIADQGMNALALTDNGALYGAVEFFEAAKKADITPIIGLDVSRRFLERPYQYLHSDYYRQFIHALFDTRHKTILARGLRGLAIRTDIRWFV